MNLRRVGVFHAHKVYAGGLLDHICTVGIKTKIHHHLLGAHRLEGFVLFFDKGTATKKVWYYQLNVGRNMGKTNPLNQKDMAEFVQMSKKYETGDNSWVIGVADIDKDTYDLTVNNPNTVEEVDNRTPQEIIAEIEQLDAKASEALKAIKELL